MADRRRTPAGVGRAARRRLREAGVVDRRARLAVSMPLVVANALDVIAMAHGTDKSSRAHGYTRHYARHLGPRRWDRLRVLEIGVGGDDDPAAGGASLRMWRDYLPRSLVVGVDVAPKRLEHLGDRVVVEQADQCDPDALLAIAHRHGPFDLVVDDGAHTGPAVHISLEALLPSVTSGGWYVVEDLHASWIPGFGGGPDPRSDAPIGLVRRAVTWAQADDPALARGGVRGPGPGPAAIDEVHVYPGIAFLRRA